MMKQENQRRRLSLTDEPTPDGLVKSSGFAPVFPGLSPVLMDMEQEVFIIAGLLLLVLVLLVLLIYSTFRAKRLIYRAQDRLREKVAQDFHDELGSKLTIITLYSELTRQAIDAGSEPAQQYLGKISRTAAEAYGSMKDLIWSLNTAEDTLEDLGQRLLVAAQELFEEAEIRYEVEVLSGDKQQVLPPDFKRHVLLIFKEAMHNALRHADCTEVHLRFEQHNDLLRVSLQDNGRGFDSRASLQGEGLKNIKNRARQLGGDLEIRSSELGTRVLLRCRWPHS